jgi:hypothetical protein
MSDILSPPFDLFSDETETYDRKKEFHSNNAELVHDILCLCNSYSDQDRFLVFGIGDDGTIVGVTGDPNRKTNAQFQDLIRQAHFNRLPSVHYWEIEMQGAEIGILRIRNRPDKPFFLIKDKREGQTTVRAGVVYTRIGDTNVPLRETAPEEMIELMWRERFGFGLTPRQRIGRLLLDTKNWKSIDEDNYLYHHEFPEFTIQRGEELVNPFEEPWVHKFPDSSAYSFYVTLNYHTTILDRIVFVGVDGGRYHFPLPRSTASGQYVVDSNSIGFKIALIYDQYMPLYEHGLSITQGPDDSSS